MKLKSISALTAALLLSQFPIHADGQTKETPKSSLSKMQRFTGKIIGSNVRMRTMPDVESHIVRELKKGDLLIINGEKGDFYAAEAPKDIKAYIFRSFVLDGVIEGDRVNVRLAPDRDAPIISHLSTGTQVQGKICEKNNKWLEVSIPQGTRFYVAKEFIDYAGGPEMKFTHDRRKSEVTQLLDSTSLLTQAEMRKPYTEINFNKLKSNYETVINEYKDFPREVELAKEALSTLQENYLQKKIQFLESRAKQLSRNAEKRQQLSVSNDEESAPAEAEEAVYSSTDRMKVWEPLEESLFLTWSSMHHAKTMDDFYAEQRLKAQTLSGMLESFTEPVKNKPGDYILKKNDLPVAYIYSTQLDLKEFVGKRVTLKASQRPNNNFAFPAYYVHEVE